jgi:hypothetical protein
VVILRGARTGTTGRRNGQALVEFVLAAVTVLVPLFLIIPLLGKFMDIKAASIQAARYAAWERTVWFDNPPDWSAAAKTDARIQNEIQRRFMSDTATAKLQTTDGDQGGWGGGVKPMWRDRAGNPMLTANISQGSQKAQTPGTMDSILDPVVTVIDAVDSILGASFKLDMNSLYTATVTVQTAQTVPIRQAMGVRTNLQTFSGVTPAFTMSNVIVADGWSANGADQVKKQVEGLMPLSWMQRDPIKTILNVVQYATALVAPELMPDWLKLGGEIKPNIVPTDRIITK